MTDDRRDPGRWSAAGPLPWERILSGAASGAVPLADGRVMLAGGADTALTAQEGTAFFDPRGGSWSPGRPMGTARRLHSTTLLADGRVLVTGGFTGANAYPVRPLDTAEVYDPASGDWSPAGRLREARCGHSATLLPDGSVLVAGGTGRRSADSERTLYSAELFDPALPGWSKAADMTDARSFHPAAALPDGRVLVAGGWVATRRDWRAGTALAYGECYDPATDTWTPTGILTGPRAGHTLTALADGSVLATGGSDGEGGADGRLDPYSKATVERWHPEAGGRWTREHDMPCGRTQHRAVRLRTGEVLVMGGGNDLLGDAGYRSAARYHPETRRWTQVPGMTVGRTDFAAVALPDGRVLVAGGTVRSGPATPTGAPHLLTSTSELFVL
ncbi:Kelch-like protein 17 [Streptomyces venezuelae]|uniref:Kelch repeat-containing protein n=1 Tax=Streptomyces venezuelae TaxID=54571 RepID=UPI00123A6509|nr:kelch repeat-containing protein [Streptomyces venezuelae]QES10364.1 Kelch-like protein 17 [Streptomyces venezuelae]